MTYDEYTISSEELYHHGILGMKWGVRRYQNKDGSLTPAGRDRYLDEISSAKKKIKDMKTLDSSVDEETKRRRVQFAKRDLSDLKIKQKLSNERSKSNSLFAAEKRLIEKEGYSPEQASIEAYRRDRLKKIALATAGVTVTAAAAYVAYKHWDNVADKVIDSGTLLSRVTDDNTRLVGDHFYAALSGTKDSYKYASGLFGPSGTPPAYQKTIRAIDNIKMASRGNASKVFGDLIQNSFGYRDDVISTMEGYLEKTRGRTAFGDSTIPIVKEAIEKLRAGKYDERVYDGFNVALVTGSSSANKFYCAMINRGYDAIVDMNDKKYGGFGTKMPLIVFNKSKVIVDDIKKLEESDFMENLKKSSSPLDSGYAGILGALASTPAVYALSNEISKRSNDYGSDKTIVSEYKKDHPNSKLSDRDIVRNHYGYK